VQQIRQDTKSHSADFSRSEVNMTNTIFVVEPLLLQFFETTNPALTLTCKTSFIHVAHSQHRCIVCNIFHAISTCCPRCICFRQKNLKNTIPKKVFQRDLRFHNNPIFPHSCLCCVQTSMIDLRWRFHLPQLQNAACKQSKTCSIMIQEFQEKGMKFLMFFSEQK